VGIPLLKKLDGGGAGRGGGLRQHDVSFAGMREAKPAKSRNLEKGRIKTGTGRDQRTREIINI